MSRTPNDLSRELATPEAIARIAHIVLHVQAGAVESTDGGRSWKALGGIQGATWVSWDPSNTEEIIAVASGSAARSSDGGRTWDRMEIPPGAGMVEFSPHDSETLYAAVHQDPIARIWISKDGGETWGEV